MLTLARPTTISKPNIRTPSRPGLARANGKFYDRPAQRFHSESNVDKLLSEGYSKISREDGGFDLVKDPVEYYSSPNTKDVYYGSVFSFDKTGGLVSEKSYSSAQVDRFYESVFDPTPNDPNRWVNVSRAVREPYAVTEKVYDPASSRELTVYTRRLEKVSNGYFKPYVYQTDTYNYNDGAGTYSINTYYNRLDRYVDVGGFRIDTSKVSTRDFAASYNAQVEQADRAIEKRYNDDYDSKMNDFLGGRTLSVRTPSRQQVTVFMDKKALADYTASVDVEDLWGELLGTEKPMRWNVVKEEPFTAPRSVSLQETVGMTPSFKFDIQPYPEWQNIKLQPDKLVVPKGVGVNSSEIITPQEKLLSGVAGPVKGLWSYSYGVGKELSYREYDPSTGKIKRVWNPKGAGAKVGTDALVYGGPVLLEFVSNPLGYTAATIGLTVESFVDKPLETTGEMIAYGLIGEAVAAPAKMGLSKWAANIERAKAEIKINTELYGSVSKPETRALLKLEDIERVKGGLPDVNLRVGIEPLDSITGMSIEEAVNGGLKARRAVKVNYGPTEFWNLKDLPAKPDFYELSIQEAKASKVGGRYMATPDIVGSKDLMKAPTPFFDVVSRKSKVTASDFDSWLQKVGHDDLLESSLLKNDLNAGEFRRITLLDVKVEGKSLKGAGADAHPSLLRLNDLRASSKPSAARLDDMRFWIEHEKKPLLPGFKRTYKAVDGGVQVDIFSVRSSKPDWLMGFKVRNEDIFEKAGMKKAKGPITLADIQKKTKASPSVSTGNFGDGLQSELLMKEPKTKTKSKTQTKTRSKQKSVNELVGGQGSKASSSLEGKAYRIVDVEVTPKASRAFRKGSKTRSRIGLAGFLGKAGGGVSGASLSLPMAGAASAARSRVGPASKVGVASASKIDSMVGTGSASKPATRIRTATDSKVSSKLLTDSRLSKPFNWKTTSRPAPEPPVRKVPKIKLPDFAKREKKKSKDLLGEYSGLKNHALNTKKLFGVEL